MRFRSKTANEKFVECRQFAAEHNLTENLNQVFANLLSWEGYDEEGRQNEVVIGSDFCEKSFSFYEEYRDGLIGLCGGDHLPRDAGQLRRERERPAQADLRLVHPHLIIPPTGQVCPGAGDKPSKRIIMKFYVLATERQDSEMRPGGIVLEKHVIICNNHGQALRVSKELKERKERFSAIQMTQTPPVLNTKLYKPVLSEAAKWLQGRS